MNKKSRRNVLKGIAISVPATWAKPVVVSVVLPVHATTSVTENFSETQSLTYNDFFPEGSSQIDCSEFLPSFPLPPTFDFNVSGLSPVGDGTITATAVGDVESVIEFYTIAIEGNDLVPTVGGSGAMCTAPGVTQLINVTEALLQSAAGDGTITITATPNDQVDCMCGGQDLNSISITLEFPYVT